MYKFNYDMFGLRIKLILRCNIKFNYMLNTI